MRQKRLLNYVNGRLNVVLKKESLRNWSLAKKIASFKNRNKNI